MPKLLVPAAVALVLVVVSVSLFSSQGQFSKPAHPQAPFLVGSPQGNALVTDGDRGPTYHIMERQAQKVTTSFSDTVTVAERAVDGQLVSRVFDRAGNELAKLRVTPVDAYRDTLEFTHVEGEPLRAARSPNLRPTLDWASTQAHSLWKDRQALRMASPRLEWQNMHLRPLGASRRDPKAEIQKVETTWRDGLTTTVTRKVVTHPSYLTNLPTTGVVLISIVTLSGIEIGQSQWFPAEQTFAWEFPGLTAGHVTSERLTINGGWTFTPDMAWLNTQNFAFHEFGTVLKERGKISQRSNPGWFDRVTQVLAPAVAANEPGCDGLHWLDGTIFRHCCDDHDRCYYTQAQYCGASSWWSWGNWQCFNCNVQAFTCFISGNGGHVLQRFP